MNKGAVAIGILVIVGIIVSVILIIINSSNSSPSSKTSNQIQKALAAGKRAGSSAASSFVPNYVPPNPTDDDSFLKKILDLAEQAPAMLITPILFDKMVEKLTPKELQTFKGMFGRNAEFLDKINSKSAINLAKNTLGKIKNATSLARMAGGQLAAKDAQAALEGARPTEKIVGERVAQTSSKLAVEGAEMGAKAGAELAADASMGPIGAALMVVQGVGMALDFANVDHLQDWEQNTTTAYDKMKSQADNNFATTANTNQMQLPLIAGPLDQIESNIFASLMTTNQVDLLTGALKPSNPNDAKTIGDIQVAIVNAFVKSVQGSSSPVTLRDAFNAATISSLSDAQQSAISNIAFSFMCTQADGTLVNGNSCSFKDSNTCNLTDTDVSDYLAGAPSSRSQYSEWRTKDSIMNQFKTTIDLANACVVMPVDVRMACNMSGHKDINGRMHVNSYDTTSGRCFNTAEYCLSYGIQYDSGQRRCYENDTIKVFSFIFGSTITQGSEMVLHTAVNGIATTLDKIGPAGKFIGDVVRNFVNVQSSIMLVSCTLIMNDFSIVEDIFTGNFNDITNRLNGDLHAIENAAKAIGGFFKAIAHDFFDLF